MRHSPPGTATYAALHPRWHSDEAELLRSLEFGMRLLLHRTPIPKGAPSQMPEPFYWPWERDEQLAKRRASGFVGDEIPYDEVAAEILAAATRHRKEA